MVAPTINGGVGTGIPSGLTQLGHAAAYPNKAHDRRRSAVRKSRALPASKTRSTRANELVHTARDAHQSSRAGVPEYASNTHLSYHGKSQGQRCAMRQFAGLRRVCHRGRRPWIRQAAGSAVYGRAGGGAYPAVLAVISLRCESCTSVESRGRRGIIPGLRLSNGANVVFNLGGQDREGHYG